MVDRGIERMQHVFDDFFYDQSTAWIFTADHGMTDWGSHGAGSDEEVSSLDFTANVESWISCIPWLQSNRVKVLTPFVAWGAGVQKGGPRSTIAQV